MDSYKELAEIARISSLRSVKKEYHSFLNSYFEKYSRKAFDLIIDDSLKITFYKEMFIYLINEEISDERWVWIFYNTKENQILEDLWNIYKKNELSREDNDFMAQFIEFHNSNEIRIRLKKETAEALNGTKR